MSSRRTLDVIQVNEPCEADWATMTGDEQRRFCAHCGKFVHNLSAMSADEAEQLVCASAGNLCVRFAREVQTGKVATLNYAPVAKSSRRRAIVTIAAIMSAVCTTSTWAVYKLLKPAAPPPLFIMGEMSPPNAGGATISK